MSAAKILLTGGTGSFGKAFIRKIIYSNINVERLVIFSRDELKQWEMQKEFSTEKYPFLRYFIGDISSNNFSFPLGLQYIRGLWRICILNLLHTINNCCPLI